jgi:hypothetical protein
MFSVRQNPTPEFLSHGFEVIGGSNDFLQWLHVTHRLAVTTDALLHRSNAVLMIRILFKQVDVSDDHSALVIE